MVSTGQAVERLKRSNPALGSITSNEAGYRRNATFATSRRTNNLKQVSRLREAGSWRKIDGSSVVAAVLLDGPRSRP